MDDAQTGLARLASEGSSLLEGRRLGLLVNPTAVDAELRHAIDLLARAHRAVDSPRCSAPSTACAATRRT